jgi:hypothetical protein
LAGRRLLKSCNEPAPDAPFALPFGCLVFLSLLGLLYHTKLPARTGSIWSSSFEVQPWCVARLLDARSKLLEGAEPFGDIRDTQTNYSCSGIHNESLTRACRPGTHCWAISIAPHDIVNAIASKKGRPGQPAPKAKPVATADFALTLNLKAALVAVGFIVMLVLTR